MAKKRIAVLFGGASADHKASLRTAYNVLCAMPKDEYDPLPIGITRAGRWLFYPGSFENIPNGVWETDTDACQCVLSPDAMHKGVIKIMQDGQTSIHRIDAVFPLLHGKYGEDGRIQGLCKLSGVPVIGSDLAASNLCLDRKLTNLLLSDAGIDVASYLTFNRGCLDHMDRMVEMIKEKLTFPLYVAPTNCSSAIGAYRAENDDELDEAIKSAFSHHPTIIVEEDLEGIAIECAVLSDSFVSDRFPVAQLKATDVNGKNVARYSELIIPAEIDENTAKKAKEISVGAFRALGCKFFARVDLMVTNKKIVVRRVRAVPGLAENSAFSKIAKAGGGSYGELIDRLICAAIDYR